MYPKAILSVPAFMKICWLPTFTIICWQPLCNTISEDHLERLVILHCLLRALSEQAFIAHEPERASFHCTWTWASKRYFLPERASVCFSQLDSHSFLSGQECNVHRSNNRSLEIFISRTMTAQRWPSMAQDQGDGMAMKAAVSYDLSVMNAATTI